MCKWIMNTEASNHMNFHKATFDTYDTYEVISSCNVYLDDDSIMRAYKIGFITIEVIVKDNIKRICINNTLHVPKLQENLLSVSKLLSNGLKVQFKLKECTARGPDIEVDCNKIT